MTDHAPSSGIWKGPDSPAGHEFYSPKSRADLPDCPFCRYGTPVFRKKSEDWICIDCRRVMKELPKKP